MTTLTAAGKPSRLRYIALFLAAPMVFLQAINALRALSDPAAFALYLGAPLAAAVDAAWVHVYAFRAAFIALLVAVFLVQRNLAALKWTALAALVMPLGDAWTTWSGGAALATVVRHLVIAAYVLIAGIVFWLADARRGA